MTTDDELMDEDEVIAHCVNLLLNAFQHYLDAAHGTGTNVCKHGELLAECYEDCVFCFVEALIAWKLDEGVPLADLRLKPAST